MTLSPVANAHSTGSHGGGFLIPTYSIVGSASFGKFMGNAATFNALGAVVPIVGGLTDNLIKVLHVGDIYSCPIHGPNPIIAGSMVWVDNGRAIVRLGDPTQCGAVVTAPGSPEWDSQ